MKHSRNNIKYRQYLERKEQVAADQLRDYSGTTAPEIGEPSGHVDYITSALSFMKDARLGMSTITFEQLPVRCSVGNKHYHR